MSYDDQIDLDEELQEDEVLDEMSVVMGPSIFAVGDVADVALEVRFDLLTTSLTLREISQIAPGQSLDVAIDLQAPIDISIDGQRVGVGSLVRVGEKTCVQVTRWNVGGLPS